MRTDSAGTSHHVGPLSEIVAELRQKAEYPTVGPVHTRIIPVRLLLNAAAALESLLPPKAATVCDQCGSGPQGYCVPPNFAVNCPFAPPPKTAPGTPEARLRFVSELAEKYCGHSPVSSEPPELALERVLSAPPPTAAPEELNGYQAELYREIASDLLGYVIKKSREDVARPSSSAAIDRAFQMLALHGVPQDRAKTVANGIDVLASRMVRERLEYEDEVRRLGRDLAEAKADIAKAIDNHSADLSAIGATDEARTLLELLVGLKLIKRRIEAGTATVQDTMIYNTTKEAVWEKAEALFPNLRRSDDTQDDYQTTNDRLNGLSGPGIRKT